MIGSSGWKVTAEIFWVCPEILYIYIGIYDMIILEENSGGIAILFINV